MFNLDLSIFIIVGLLVVLNWILTRILYRPVLDNYHNRQSYLLTMSQETNENNEKTSSLILEMKQQLEKAKLEAELKEKQILQKAEETALKNLHEQLVDTHQCFIACRSMLNADEEDIARTLQSSVSDMAQILKKTVLPIAILTFWSLLFTSTTLAAGANGSQEHHPTTIHGDLEKGLSFIIMVGILTYFLRKPAMTFFRNRSREIESVLINNKRDLQNSREAALEIVAQQAQIDEKIENLFDIATQRANEVGEEVLENSRKQLQKIRTQHEHECEFLRLQAFQTLKRRFVNDTMTSLYQDFENGIRLETDKKLVNNILDQLDDFLATHEDFYEKFTH